LIFRRCTTGGYSADCAASNVRVRVRVIARIMVRFRGSIRGLG
jgi:hypothetical protein